PSFFGFPKNKIKIQLNKSNQKWISKGLKISCSKKRYLRSRYYKNKNEENKHQYKTYSHLLQKCIYNSKKLANVKFINKNENKCKATWSIVKEEISNAKPKDNIDSIKVNDTILTNPLDIATAFNNYFITPAHQLTTSLNQIHKTQTPIANSIDHESEINSTVDNLIHWLNKNKLKMNLQKSVYIQFNQSSNSKYNFNMNIHKISKVTHTKFLGITIDEMLCWKEHTNTISNKINKFVYALRQVRYVTNINTAILCYHSYVESILLPNIAKTVWPCVYAYITNYPQSLSALMLVYLRKNYTNGSTNIIFIVLRNIYKF
ncbi:hypothetical protein SFRURICE_008040, partial [Spodoptera frugiperda]